MDLDEQELKSKFRVDVAQLDRFDRLARDAHAQPWWQAIVKAIQERRMMFVTLLCDGKQEQREEDRLRGQIAELNFLLFLNDRARELVEDEHSERREHHG